MMIKPKLIVPALLLLTVLGGCGRDEDAPRQETIRPVRYIRVALRPAMEARTFSGIARAVRESKLSFRVGGIIQFIGVDVGDSLQEGQLIARLDPTDYQLNLRKAEASLAQAEAEARNATANFERIRALYENRNASLNDMDAARAAYESGRAKVRALENQIALARRQLGYTRLSAPSACAVAQVPVEINENVAPGQAVAIITSGSNLEVRVAVPEGIITRIREQAQAAVTFDVVPDKTFAAVITEVGVTTVGLDTTFPVTVRLDNTDSRIRPGMAAEVTFQLHSTAEAARRIFLPPVAVGEDPQGRFVYTVENLGDGFGIVHRRGVQVGAIGAGGLEIIEGLAPGELVVTAGITRIEAGLKVKLL